MSYLWRIVPVVILINYPFRAEINDMAITHDLSICGIERNIACIQYPCKFLHHRLIWRCVVNREMAYLEMKKILCRQTDTPLSLVVLTFTVIPARSRSSTTVLASVLPSWPPRKRWKAINAVLSWRAEYPFDLEIQWAVIARYGCRFWSDHTSVVKDILPAASCASPETLELIN